MRWIFVEPAVWSLKYQKFHCNSDPYVTLEKYDIIFTLYQYPNPFCTSPPFFLVNWLNAIPADVLTFSNIINRHGIVLGPILPTEIILTSIGCRSWIINTLRPRQNGRHFADDTFKRIFLNENVRISIKISPTFVSRGPINNIPALVQTMAWRRPGDKPLSEPMMVSLPTHICVTRPQWVNYILQNTAGDHSLSLP